MSGVPAPRRPGPSRRRALALLLATGLALVGLGILAVGWFGLGVTTLRATAVGTEPCLVAYDAGEGREIRYELLPARAVCVQDVDGVPLEVVVASVPQAVTVSGIVLALVGAVGTAALLLHERRVAADRRRGAAPPSSSGPAASRG